MKSKLLVAIAGLLLIVPNNGLPLPEKDTLNENKEQSSKIETASTEKPTEVTSNNNNTSQSSTSKPNEQPKETEPVKEEKSPASTTPEPDVEEDEDQVYLLLPKRQKSDRIPNFNPEQQFYFKPGSIHPQLMLPQLLFKQQALKTPFPYPMMFQPRPHPSHSMKTNNHINFDFPLGFYDGSSMFSIPQSQRQAFGMNTDDTNNSHSSLFLPQDHSWYGGVVDPIYSKLINKYYS